MAEQTMIERIARLCAVWAEARDPDAWLAFQGVARLILALMREPSPAMTQKAREQTGIHHPRFEEIYRHMIEAALAEPDQTKPE